MPDALDGLRHDAGAVYRLTEDIEQFCDQRRLQHQYIGASSLFFEHVGDVARKTLEYLKSFDSVAPASERRIRAHRLRLISIKNYWLEIHELLKPVADAHALAIPISLVDLLCTRVKGIRGVADAQIAILVSEQLNYFQSRNAGLRDVYTHLSAVVPNLPIFPKGLGFIGIPFSQGSSLFTSLVIFHELAHFIFEETLKGAELDQMIGRATDSTFGSSLSASDKLWTKERLLRWAEEIFCDLFAVRLLGPAYTFAYIELLNLMGVTDPKRVVNFSESHPADACRIREHLSRLQRDGWSEVLDSLNLEYVNFMKDLSSIPESSCKLLSVN